MVEVANLAQLELPSKWDIIPIHASDRAKFKDCRRAWDWSSPARQNLTPRADVTGVYFPFFFGNGCHYALEQMYNPGLRRDPVESFKTWYDIQWRGGIVTADWLSRTYDLIPEVVMSLDNVPLMPESYKVRGLQEILPEGTESYDEVESCLSLGVAMMENYKLYAKGHDGFEPLMAESDFSIPIWDYTNNCILQAVDFRQDSPNYGKRLEVHARGRRDMLYVKPNGKLGIFDHKTADKMEDSHTLDEILESDEQITTYLWATEIEAQYYDLPHKGEQIEEAVYQVLRKAAPTDPTIVRGGLFSMARQTESTTFGRVMKWMQDANVKYADLSEKHQGYVDWLREVGDEQFIVRKVVRRNREQLRQAGYRAYQEALDMLTVAAAGDLMIYPNLRRDWSCRKCIFRPPCLAKEAGEDWQYLINENYASNKDR